MSAIEYTSFSKKLLCERAEILKNHIYKRGRLTGDRINKKWTYSIRYDFKMNNDILVTLETTLKSRISIIDFIKST